MRLGYKWLQDYIDLDMTPSDLADRLTMVGLEVEEIEDRYAYLDKVVAARITAVEDHPRSDTLKVCRVDTGQDTYQVVCGAPNTAPGMISSLALPGVELPGGNMVGEAEIRGVTSRGMLCSEAELILGPDGSGIMDLPDRTDPGRNLKQILDLEDWVYEIGLTPNRPDCLCVLGVAREVAGIMGRELKKPAARPREEGRPIEELTSVTLLDPEHSPRYTARVITGVKIGPSPFWMIDRLASVGLRAINNVVDITNFVLMETGQPLHAFDMDRLEEGRVVVKVAREGDRFTTLDGTERILGPEMLMICDAAQQVGLAGVMGGLNSEIVDDTQNVLLESAYFSPVSIRRTSKTLGLSTEASYRFERGIDPNVCVYASNRAADLMAELAGGVVARGIIDQNPIPHEKRIIPFSASKCNAYLGTDFSTEEMIGRMRGIELDVSGSEDHYKVEAPSFRVDLEREVDLFEEVARLVGFARVPATIPHCRAEHQPFSPDRALAAEARPILEGLGLSEVVNYSFISEDFCDRLNLAPDSEARRTVRILNPLSEDQALMRTSLVPGLLEVLRRNQSYNVPEVALYEMGVLFFDRPGEELPEERPALAGILAGNRNALSWHEKPAAVDFFDIKGVVQDLVDGLGLPEPTFQRGGCPPYYQSGAAATIRIGELKLGCVGRVSPATAKAYSLRDEAYVFEFDINAILAARQGTPVFVSLPRFPAVGRDLAAILGRDVPAGQVLDFIHSLGEDFVTEIILFDAYEGPQVGQGRKSLAFRLMYRSPDRTLTDEEVNAIHDRITAQVLQTFDATLRP